MSEIYVICVTVYCVRTCSSADKPETKSADKIYYKHNHQYKSNNICLQLPVMFT
jgi:hypothetical protein